MANTTFPVEQAARLHRTALVADGHTDTIGRLYVEGGSLVEPPPGQHVDLDRLRRSGVGLVVCACCPVWGKLQLPAGARRDYARTVFGMIDVLHRELSAHPELRLVTDPAGLTRLEKERRAGTGVIGVALALEGGEALEGDLALLRTFHRLGVRLLTLTHNPRNELADGVAEAAAGGGLTTFGRQVVAECNRLGIVVDVSHLAPAGFWQVLEGSAAPVIASHSNARALCDHPRNLTDEQVRALAATGGTIGVTFAPQFLREGPDDQHPMSTSLSDVLDQVEYLMRLAGPESVALGSDFDGIECAPEGLTDVSFLPALTGGLLARGWAEPVVRGFLGGNLLRVFRTVWR